MGKVKSLSELSEMATNIAPRMFGEIKADGQFRGHMSKADTPTHVIVVGDYLLWKLGDGEIGIGYRPTGEMGIFKAEDFESYIKAFFGLNF